MKPGTVRKIKRTAAGILAAVFFVSSELSAYGALIPQENTAEEGEEKEREVFDYPEANVYEGETEPSADQESGTEIPEQEEEKEREEPEEEPEEPEQEEEEETEPEEEKEEHSLEKPEEEQEPEASQEEVPLLAPELAQEEIPYAEEGEEPIEVGKYYKTYQNPDGSYRTVYTSSPNLYEDENGEERPIDNTLVFLEEERPMVLAAAAKALEWDPSKEHHPASGEVPGGVYVNRANSMRVELPAVMDPENGRGLTIEEEGLCLTLVPAEGDYSHGAAEENAVRYNQVFEQIDVQYTVQDTGVKEDIILLAPTERNSFSYLLKKDGFTAREEEGLIFIIPEGREEPAAVMSAPVMSDAAGKESRELRLSLSEEEEAYRITAEADRDWLSDPARVYPVKIDPHTIVLKNELTLITVGSDYPLGTYNAISPVYAGYESRMGKCRLFVISDFLYEGIGAEKEGSVTVLSASMHLYQRSKLGSGQLACYAIDQSYRFSGAGSWNALVNLKRHPAGVNSVVSSKVGWQTFDITDAVNGWNQGLHESHGLVLIATNENQGVGAFASECDSNTGLRPYYEINWKYKDEIDPDYPLDDTTVILRPIVKTDIQGKLNLLGVFADGIATPDSQVVYALSEDGGTYSGAARAKSRTDYPNSAGFEKAFPQGSTRYRQGVSNWQTAVPFTALEANKVYRLEVSAVKGGKAGKTVYSEEFLKYKVTRYDTLPKIADYYGIPLGQLMYDNRVQDMLLVEGNTLLIRNPARNKDKPYQPPALTDADKAAIDSQLMGRGLHCEFGFEPINLNTGNFYLEQEDSSVPDYGEALSITRSYNSRGAEAAGAFGRGFSFAYDEQLTRKDEDTLLYRRGDGSILEFARQEDGSYTSPAGYGMILRQVPDGKGEITNPTTEEQAEEEAKGETSFGTYQRYRYELEEQKDGGGRAVRSFDSSGLLTGIQDEKGNRITLGYGNNGLLASLTSASGLTYRFQWEKGHIRTITRPDGKKLTYEYSQENELISYTDSLGITLRYEYDENHRMTAWYDGNGDRMAENEYDEQGRVTKQRDGNGGVSSFSYQEGQTTTVDALGQKTVYRYDDQYRTKEIVYPDGTSEAYTYTEGNQKASHRDRLGHTTAYAYDGRGNLTAETRFDGAVRRFAYDGENRLVSQTDYSGGKTSYEYDGKGNLTKTVRPDGSSLIYSYNGKNQITGIRDPEGNTVTLSYTGVNLTGIRDAEGNQSAFAYDALGNLISVKDPEGNTSRREYDGEGRKIRETDALGGCTSYVYDKGGNVRSITDPAGNTTAFTYDANGNVLRAEDPEGNLYAYTYDALNRCVMETLPDGTRIRKAYDTEGNCILETDGEDNAYTYRYDPLGNLLEEKDPQGRTVAYTYDYRNNRLETRTDALGGVLRLEYDIQGNPVRFTMENGAMVTYAYDKLGRLIREENEASGLIMEYAYDKNGNLTNCRDSQGKSWSYVYDRAGNLTEQILPNGGSRAYEYDACGRVTKETDALGHVTAYAYDACGRVLSRTDAQGNTTSYAYDANGNEISRTDALGHTTRTVYDGLNRAVGYIDGRNFLTAAAYDGAGNLTSLTDALKGTTAYAYDGRGLAVEVTDALGNVYRNTFDASGSRIRIEAPDGTWIRYAYDALGRQIRSTDSEGLVKSYAYDGAGNLLEASDNEGHSTRYAYDQAGNLLSVTDALGNATSYTYDAYGRVLSVTDPAGSTARYTYDAMGNIESYTDGAGFTTSYAYDQENRCIGVSDALHGTQAYTYDALGNLKSDTNPLGETNAYEYDALGRVTEILETGGLRTQYAYDASGNLTEETDPNGNKTSYEYDALDRLISITEADGSREDYLYDALGNLVKYQDALGHVTSYGYDSVSQMTELVLPEGGTWHYAYDGHGKVIKETDPLGRETSYAYSKSGELVKRTLADGAEYRYHYDLLGRITGLEAPEGRNLSWEYSGTGDLIRETDAKGNAISYTYDNLHRLLSVTNPEGGKTSYAYDEAGNLTSSVSPMGTESSFRYDALDRLSRSYTPGLPEISYTYDEAGNLAAVTETGRESRTTRYTYDLNGNLLTEADPLDQRKTYAYDSRNRLIETASAGGRREQYAYDGDSRMTGIRDALGKETRLSYDGNDNLISLSDGEGRTVTYTYDQADQLIQAAEEGAVTAYTYDSAGNVSTVTDGEGHTASYAYDLAGRLISRTNALGETQGYAYDLNDCLEAFTRGDGSIITYDYDKLNRLAVTDYSGAEEGASQVLYAYDPQGRRISMEDVTGTSTYTYDQAGRMESVTDGRGNKVSYEYDGFGNLSALIYPDGSRVSYAYDILDRLTEVTDRQGGITSYAYDPDGLLLEVKRPNGTKTVLTYDGAGRAETIQNLDKGGRELSFYRYAYDGSGFVTREEVRQKREGRTEEFTNAYAYDARGQLVFVSTEKEGKTSEIRYAYDQAGNRITVEKNEDTVRSYLEEYAYDGAGRLKSRRVTGNREHPSRNGTTSYIYDKNGNLIREIGPEEQITEYAYDVENRLKAVMEGDRLLMAALYDGDGNRVFRMEYEGTSGGGAWSGAAREETVSSITKQTKGEAGSSGSPLIPHAWEAREEWEEVTETRNNIFWYGFGQGLIQGLTSVPGYLGRWLHEHWEYILKRTELHRTSEIHTFAEKGDEARKPKEGDTWTSLLYDEIFIPYQVGEEARENYVQTSYVNDVNRAYTETLAEYRISGERAGSPPGPEASEGAVYEYGLQRLSYRDTGSGDLFTYLYDGRGSVSNVTFQSGGSVISYFYDAYGTASAYSSTGSRSPASALGNPYDYNGEFTDPATGFQYLRSRYYNSRTGNFLTEDSYGGSVLEPLSQNRYAYTGNNPINLTDPSGHAWISGTAAKIAAAGKKAAAKPSTSKSGAVKSGAASAIKSAAKKAVTAAKNTVSSSSQTSKGTSKQNVSGGVKTAGTKIMNAGLSSVKSGGSTGSRSPAKTDWQQTIANSMSGTAAGTVRKVTTGQSYINNKLFTASSAAERKLCANADWLSKGNAALGDGVLKGISQAVTDIWNQSMSASPIGKLFPEPGKKSGPGIGNTVMEITERVIKEQEQRKEQERIWESRYELRYGEESSPDGSAAKEKIQELARTYGEKSYTSREELISSPLVNLTARVIYGEQTNAGEGQDVVAWTMINRVLSQNKAHTRSQEVTLYNVLTTPRQYTVLEKERDNFQSYEEKDFGTSEWSGWQHAFEIAYWMDEILGDIGENTTQEELEVARKRLEEAIGESPIGTGQFFRAEDDFKEKLLIKEEGGEKAYYYNGNRIRPDYVPKGGNVFFEYYD